MEDLEVETNNVEYVQRKQSDIIKHALKDNYKQLDEKDLRELVREIIFAPNKRIININGREVRASDLRYEIAANIEDFASKRMSSNSDEAQIAIAQSIENINSGTNSTEEYFSWLNQTSDILKNMNDGFVSTQDLETRNTFLENTDQREVELMLCLGMFMGCTNNKADDYIKVMRYKLQKLREMRSAIKQTTRNQSDVEINRSEYERAIPYYKAFKSLLKLPFGYDISKQQKIDLNIYHDDDEELSEDFDYYDILLERALDEMKEEDTYYIASREYQLAYDMALERNLGLANEISDKMKKLSGRKNLFKLKYEQLNSD